MRDEFHLAIKVKRGLHQLNTIETVNEHHILNNIIQS